MARNHALQGPVYDMIRDLIAEGHSPRDVQAIVQRETGEVFSLHQIGGMKPHIHAVMRNGTDPLVTAICLHHPYIFKGAV